MYLSTTAATAVVFLATSGLAAPSVDARPVQVEVDFQGAAGVEQTQTVPADGEPHEVAATFSVSHIEILGPVPASVNCYAYGVDGSVTHTFGAGTVDVGPPQVQTTITCYLGRA